MPLKLRNYREWKPNGHLRLLVWVLLLYDKSNMIRFEEFIYLSRMTVLKSFMSKDKSSRNSWLSEDPKWSEPHKQGEEGGHIEVGNWFEFGSEQGRLILVTLEVYFCYT